jgi:hypothetical protein
MKYVEILKILCILALKNYGENPGLSLVWDLAVFLKATMVSD